jgi:thiamine-phosphate pyrophosphorylase
VRAGLEAGSAAGRDAGTDAVRVLVVTDGLRDVTASAHVLETAHREGVPLAVLVRAYDAPIDAQVAFARELRTALPRELPVLFAGHPARAREAGADGVHLGRRVASVAEARAAFGPGAWVSVPAHAPQDIDAAEREGAFAALVSPVLGVPGKGQPLGFSGLSCFVTQASPQRIRVFALGGLGPADVGPCLRAGAHGVAVIRAVWGAPDPLDALRSLAAAFAHGA